jgi:hypothetical protein
VLAAPTKKLVEFVLVIVGTWLVLPELAGVGLVGPEFAGTWLVAPEN